MTHMTPANLLDFIRRFMNKGVPTRLRGFFACANNTDENDKVFSREEHIGEDSQNTSFVL